MQEVKYYPLSPDQEGLFVFLDAFPSQLLNMTARIMLDSPVDDEKILEAMRLTVKRIDYLNLRLHKLEDGTKVQYYCDEEPVGVEAIDLSSKTAEEITEYVAGIGQTPFDNDCYDVPLYRMKLILGPDGKRDLVIGGFHVMMDAQALMAVVVYFDKVYYALANGTELPAPLEDCFKLIDWDINFAKSGKIERDNQKCLEALTPEPCFTSPNGLGSPEFVEGKRYGRDQDITQYEIGILTRKLPASLMDRINASAAKTGFSSQLYLILAMRSFLGKVCETDDVTMVTTASRRATLVQKRGGLTMAHYVYVRSVIEPSVTALEALRILSNVRNDAYKYAGQMILHDVATALTEKYGIPAGFRYWTVQFTYQPYFDMKSANLKFRTDFLTSGLASCPLYLNIMPQDNTGDMYANYWYGKGYLNDDSLNRFHDFMMKFLDIAVDNLDKSVGELTELSM